MKLFDDYHLPSNVTDALALLACYDGRARVVAGGTDLLVDTQAEYYAGHRPHFDALVDVTRLEGADRIVLEDGWLVIGCGVTHTQIVESALVQKYATALAEGCHVVGGPQVRNVATLCGNVAHALPAADGTVALMALNAEAQVAALDEGGLRNSWQALPTMFQGPGKSAIDSTRELLTSIRLRPTGPGEGSAFARVMRPQGVALPILGMAVRVVLRNGVVEDVAISAGPVAPTPFRATEAEEFLRGKRWDEELLSEATELLIAQAKPRTSAHRATADYRFELLPTLLRDVLTTAIQRGGQLILKVVGHALPYSDFS